MKHKLSKLAVGLVAALAISGQANANSIDISSAGGWTLGTNGNYTSYNAGAFSGSPLTSYSDVFNINVTANNSTLTTSLQALEGFANTSTVTETLGSQTYTATYPPLSSATVNGTFSNLNVGSYFLTVTAKGSNPGFSLNSTLTAPVPEPTEGALLLSGIGLLGFIASRRKNNA